MSAWTAMVWSQAAAALLGGTQDCDIPHNTLGLDCEGREGMEWVVEMMERNLEHHPTNLSHLTFLPTVDDLEVAQVYHRRVQVVGEGRGVRIRIPEERILRAMAAAEEEMGPGTEVVEEDRVPALTITTHNMYSALGKHVELVSLEPLCLSDPGGHGRER